jgi:hypothetical protein
MIMNKFRIEEKKDGEGRRSFLPSKVGGFYFIIPSRMEYLQ